MNSKILSILVFTLIFSTLASAVINNDSMKIYAVTTEGTGLVATLNLEIEKGDGKIWTSVTPLVGTSTQNAEKTAVRVSEDFFSQNREYDYKFSIESNASVVDGPSAGAAMALLAISMLTDRDIKDNVSITGTITQEGRIGPVGGIFEKAREAGKTGVKLFLIPKGEAIQTVKLPEGVRSINLLDYGPREFGIKVAEVNTIEEAVKIAHSNIESLDINTSATDAVPDFVPEKITLPNRLGSFKVLTTNHIAETKLIISEARNSLSSSLLEDAQVIQSLLEVLNSSEQTIHRAEILNEQNYLYSAANFSFLARVNAIMVKEISTNPKLLQLNSTAFDLRLLELKREIVTFENDLSAQIPKDGVEWLISAQQRYAYAKSSVDKLIDEGKTIVVGGTNENETEVAFTKLRDYAFAVAWLDVSKDFYNLSQESGGFVKRDESFGAKAITAINSATEDANLSNSELDEDIKRRINSAKVEAEMKWFEASYLDAVSARAMISAQDQIEGKTTEEIRAILQGKIMDLDAKIAGSNGGNNWAELYLDHAKYFLEASDYYSKLEFDSSAKENLESGISLSFLSEQILLASQEVVSFYENEPVTGKVNGNGKPGGSGVKAEDKTFVFIGTTMFLLAIILILAVLLLGANHHKKKLQAQIESDRQIKEEPKIVEEETGSTLAKMVPKEQPEVVKKPKWKTKKEIKEKPAKGSIKKNAFKKKGREK